MSEEKWLRQAADEIRKEGHYGWGNTCEQAADRIAEMEQELTELREEQARRETWIVGLAQLTNVTPKDLILKLAELEQQLVELREALTEAVEWDWITDPECIPEDVTSLVDAALLKQGGE